MIKCNTGTRKANWVGNFPGYPELVWFDPGRIANTILLKQAKKYFIIKYHSEDNNGFVVTHRENGSVRCFHESQKGLFYLNFKQQREMALVTTVSNNKIK